MNPKKRKQSDDDDDSCDLEQSAEHKEIVNEIANINTSNFAENQSEKESDNGGSSQPSTSEAKTDDSKDKETSNQTESEAKQTHLDVPEVSGVLLYCGGTNFDLIGRKELPKHAKDATGPNLWGPHRLSALKGVRVKGVFSGSCAVHSIIITDAGKALTWGRNDKYQLGLGDTKRRDNPTIVETLKDHVIVAAAAGRSHTLFLSERGIVYSCGDNKLGQCGVGTQNNTVNIPTKITYKGRSIAKVATGAEFSLIVDVNGALYSFGCPEYGQLGHNSDGRYFLTSNKLSFRCELVPRRVLAFVEKSREGHVSIIEDVRIVDAACGINHSVVVDSNRRCFSFGFGGYGRLGHAEPKDEFVPRLIKAFEGPRHSKGVKRVYAGGTYSLAVNELDVLMFFGQNKRCGESTMYPKPIQDLSGWQTRDVGCCNTSIVCVADESVISWGPSPTFGELGYGESKPKSSTTPQIVKPLESIYIHAVACGYGHTLFIARDDSEAEKKKINQLPEFTP